jgi:AraC-like DNA-binding protein
MPAGFDPIYREGAAQMRVDSCGPQFAAMLEGKIRLHALTKGHYPGIKIGSENLPGINSIGYWSGTGTQDWGLDAHRNEGLEITFLETGRMAFSVEAKNYELRPGNFTITRPWQLHKLGSPNIGPGKLHWLILDVGIRRPNQDWRWPRWLALTDEDRCELTRKLRQNENPVWQATPEIIESFRGLATCVGTWPSCHLESRMIALLNRLFLEILIALGKQQTHQNPGLTSRQRTVGLFLRDLSENATSAAESWTLPRMAAQCGMGITAFSGYCRSLVNAGAVEYLNQCRVDHAAKEIVAHPTRSITEIAFANGFNSSQYFATVFCRRFRTSPTAYRDRKKNKGGGT